MKTQNWLFGASVMALLLFATSCATSEEVSELRMRIQELESQQLVQTTQQQQSFDDIYQRFQIISDNTVNIGHRLEALEAKDNQLLTADTEIKGQLSSFESRLDERMINRVLATPWEYLALAIAILLAGIAIGVWGRRIWHFVSGTDQ